MGGHMKKYMIISLLWAPVLSILGMERTAKFVVPQVPQRKSAERSPRQQAAVVLTQSTQIPVPSRKSPSLSPQCNTPVEKYSPSVYWTNEFCYLNEVADSPNDLYCTRR